MKLDIIAQLVQVLRESPEVGAVEVRRGLFGLWSVVRVARSGHPNAGGGGAHHVVVAQAPLSPLPSPAGEKGEGRGDVGTVPAAPPAHLLEIKSPMVGTFYRAPEPGAEPYVKVGTRLSPGQVVCIIEAMKIMNEIESEISGVVKEIGVEDTQPVEFGHVLFRVDPNG
ncbi:MAG: acetyl-CoA carboxylase biotin carboxyl carrier protein [Gemmatimonadales bacterium]